MTVKEYLRGVRVNMRRVGEVEERLRRMRAQLEGRVSRTSRTPGSRTRWGDCVDEMIDLERRYDEQLRELCRERLRVVKMIEGVKSPAAREVLELYYLDGLSWREVARRVSYSVRNVQILHGRALEEISLHSFSLLDVL
jgi:DNA-directed RNA polymerase specialized sigma24 family protein